MPFTAWSVAAFTASGIVLACSNPPAGPDYGDPDDGKGGSTPAAGGSGTQASAGSGTQSTGQAGTAAQGGGAPQGGSAAQNGGANGNVLGHSDPSMTYPVREGFTLTLVEEFNEAIDLVNDPNWTYSDGGLPEGDVRFVKDAISFGEGKLKITATKAPVASSKSWAEDNGDVYSKPLSSGEFRTKFNNFRYGRYEASFKAPHPGGPGVNGNMINTLFVFRTPKGQNWREIDIEVTGDSPTSVTTNVLWVNNTSEWNKSFQDDETSQAPGGFHSRDAFHTYAFEWTPTDIKWFIDDQLVRTKATGGPIAIPEMSVKIMMNLWIFNPTGGFGGDPSTNVYPMVAEYDWFRFYKWNQETTYPCTPTPACLPAEDRDRSKNNPDDNIDP